MQLQDILIQAKNGRADLAAMNLGASGFSPIGIRVLARHPHSSGVRFSQRDLYRWYSAARRESVY